MEGGYYGSVEAWRADVDLVWNNAMRFNEPTNDVHECAKKLSQAFDRMFRQVNGFSVVWTGSQLSVRGYQEHLRGGNGSAMPAQD